VSSRWTDRFEVMVRDRDAGPIVLAAGREFVFNALALSESLGLPLRPLELDLARIGAAVYAADRLVRRPPLTPHRYPARDMELTFTVSDVEFWRDQHHNLVEVLQFLGGDRLDVRFRQGPQPWQWHVSRHLFPEHCNSVSLFSDGLDSGAGLVSYLGEARDTTLTVTVVHQPFQGRQAGCQISVLPPDLRGRVVPTFTRTSLLRPPRMDQQELTQRLRGFLFTAVAGVAASRLSIAKVNVFESGVGAVNVPAMESMIWGGLATRGAHPRFLRMMGRLVTAVAGRPVEFCLPFKSMTKGEVVSRALSFGGAAVLANTASCIHYPLRQPGPAKQCGMCAGCIEHQMAMHTASCDLTKHTFRVDPRRLPYTRDDAVAFRMAVCQLHDLQQMRATGPSESFRLHLEQSGALTGVDTVEKWFGLLLRYADQGQRWVDGVTDVVRPGDAAANTALLVA
jgi:hypothetical protein